MLLTFKMWLAVEAAAKGHKQVKPLPNGKSERPYLEVGFGL